jgi:hypothetical protein
VQGTAAFTAGSIFALATTAGSFELDSASTATFQAADITTASAVPEPSSILLPVLAVMGAGLAALCKGKLTLRP